METTPVRPRVSAGAILTDEAGRVLLVDPTYKPYWNLPGGHVDEGETPHLACQRELREELGLDIEPGDLLVHAYLAVPGREPHIYYVFNGGVLTSEQQKSIRLQSSELAAHRFSAPQEIPAEDIPPVIWPLWQAALDARATGVPAYVEITR
jgi:8-oxo-dGTP diphosphatase